MLGPFIAGIVALIVGYATTLQWNGVFFVYLVAFPIWAAMLVWLFEPKRAEQPKAEAASSASAGDGFPWLNAGVVVAVTLFASLLYYVFIINGSLAFAEVGVANPERYAQLIFIPQLFILVGAVLFRVLANRGHALQIATMLMLIGGGLAGIGVAQTPEGMALALTVQQTGAGMAVPALIAWTQTKFNYAHRGAGMGLWTAAFFFGQSQSPRLVHVMDERAGSMQGAFLIAGCIGLAAAVIGFLIAASKAKGGEPARAG